MSRPARKSPAFLIAILAVACAVGACARSPEEAPAFGAHEAHDAQVPASEPRAELAVAVDLPARSDCEEAFDLALYRDRSIELVEWDRDAGGCTQRRARVRYLSARITREALITRIRSLTTKMEIMSP